MPPHIIAADSIPVPQPKSAAISPSRDYWFYLMNKNIKTIRI